MIIIVAGMHRCGTSALAGLLHKNNVLMGRKSDFYPPPMKENPKGFYENVRFRRLNDKALAQVGYKVKSWKVPPAEPIVPSDNLMAAMAELIEEYHSKFDNWGWKDPRTSLVLDSWLEILDQYGLKEETRIIQMIRNPVQVRNSMLRRGNKEPREGQFLEVAEAYRAAALKYVAEAGFEAQHKILPFKQIVRNARDAADMISEFIGLPLDDISHIDPNLERN